MPDNLSNVCSLLIFRDQSDSGGPLVCERGNGKWHLVGVTSFGMGCGHPDFSGVYVRVSRYEYFISSVVNGGRLDIYTNLKTYDIP